MLSGKVFTLTDVLYVPDHRKNLVSGSQLVHRGYKIVFDCNKIVITKNNAFIGKGYVNEGLVKLNAINLFINKAENQTYLVNKSNQNLWHARLGHVHLRKVEYMIKSKLIPKSNLDTFKCEICAKSKQPRKPFKSVKRNLSILELIHSDVCDSTKTTTRGGNRYLVTFIDNFFRYYYYYLIKFKNKTFNKFKIYKENQQERKIKILRSDRRGVYLE